MGTLDLIALVLLGLILVGLALIVARQRYMLHSPGGIPLATRRGNRWLYGVGRYDGDELQWYSAMGIGTRPNRVLRRTELQVLGRRPPAQHELVWLPSTATIVDLRDPAGEITIALSDGAVTGFVSWLEAATPHPF